MRTLQTGRGSELTFTNLQSGATLSLPSNGSVTNTVFDDDGSATVTLTGHTVLIMFPTDVPPGPSTTLYVGRVVFTVDPAGVFTILSTSGRSVDICEALSMRLAPLMRSRKVSPRVLLRLARPRRAARARERGAQRRRPRAAGARRA